MKALSVKGRLTVAFFVYKDAGMQVRCLLCMRQIFFTKGRIMTGKNTRQSDSEQCWQLHSLPLFPVWYLPPGTGMLGALISDIDVGTSKSHKDADRITLIAVLLVAAEIALNYFCNFSIWEKIRNDKSVAPVAMGVIIFIAVCALGKISRTGHLCIRSWLWLF